MRETLEQVACRVRVSEKKSVDYIISAALALVECHERVTAGERTAEMDALLAAGSTLQPWPLFKTTNLTEMKESRIGELLQIGRSEDPASTALMLREQTAARVRKHRLHVASAAKSAPKPKAPSVTVTGCGQCEALQAKLRDTESTVNALQRELATLRKAKAGVVIHREEFERRRKRTALHVVATSTR